MLRLTHPERIGHLAGEPDCLLKEQILGMAPQRRLLLLLPRDRVANARMADYWAGEMTVLRSPRACRLADPLLHFRFTRFPSELARYFVAIGETAAAIQVQRGWGMRPPLLRLTPEDEIRGERALRELGLPAGARFACLHNREGGYSPEDEHLHSFRNSRIDTYAAAAEALVARGLYCVRMGDPSMRRMPLLAGVIDYAYSALRADWLDVFLCARCEFFIGNTSGLNFVSMVFGVPCGLANAVPFSTALAISNVRDLSIPKLLWNEREGRHLSFAEALGAPVANYRFAEQYEKDAIRPVDNDPADIRDLALEMLERVEGRAEYAPEDEVLQARFKSLFRPGHYSYGSATRVGRDFLRKYASLIGDRTE